MADPWKRKEVIGDCTLYLGDCLEVMGALDGVDHIICDPPYEAVMQDNWGVLSKDRSLATVRFETLGFSAIDKIRGEVAAAAKNICNGWFVAFCMAEGVAPWRDALEASGARYKRAMVWLKPNPTPQFNGQGPGMGHEMMVSAWCGKGHSRWNGGGRAGNFVFNKNNAGNLHPTQKPNALMAELIHLFTSVSQTILDPFMGSGTTLVACAKLGRKGIGIELDPDYFEIACRRVEEAYRQPDMFIPKPAAPIQEGFL